MKMNWTWIVVLTAMGTLVANGGHAQENEEQKLVASDGDIVDNFGGSVSIDGDAAVVGAIGDDDGGSSSGSAYVFRLDESGWLEEQKLVASDGGDSDAFGVSVSISGDVALIGAFSDDDQGSGAGAAYVFRFDGATWEEEQKLLASDGAASDQFYAVGVSGDVAVTGAEGDDDNGNNAGAAYVFRFNGTTWEEEQKLLATDGQASDRLGEFVAVSGNVVLVSAVGDDDRGSGAGAAYIFAFNGSTWGQEQKLLASDGSNSDAFGTSVALRGNLAVVGAPGEDPAGRDSGSAYVFRFNGVSWVEEQKLFASDGVTLAEFGSSVAVEDDVVVVGARYDPESALNAGTAYSFHFDGANWVEEAKLLASDGASAGGQLGASAAVSGSVAFVGAPFADSMGAAYVFSVPEPEVVILQLAALGAIVLLRRRKWQIG